VLSNNKKKGNFGETAASGFLTAKGWNIIEKNYKRGRGEIDIIAKSPDGYVVFVEVKYRTTLKFGMPREAVTTLKKKAVINAALHFISEHDLQEDMRFDVIEIFGESNLTINHIENAFGLNW
jgi:putative endonuclease